MSTFIGTAMPSRMIANSPSAGTNTAAAIPARTIFSCWRASALRAVTSPCTSAAIATTPATAAATYTQSFTRR